MSVYGPMVLLLSLIAVLLFAIVEAAIFALKRDSNFYILATFVNFSAFVSPLVIETLVNHFAYVENYQYIDYLQRVSFSYSILVGLLYLAAIFVLLSKINAEHHVRAGRKIKEEKISPETDIKAGETTFVGPTSTGNKA